MKRQVSKGTAAMIVVVAVAAIGWFGWRTLGNSGVIQIDKEATYQAVEKRAKENGVDLRTVPQWAGEYYKHHPEEKPPADIAANPSAAPATSLPPGAPAGNNGAPAPPPQMH